MKGSDARRNGAIPAASRPETLWIEKELAPARFLEEAAEYGLGKITAQLLYNRNLRSLKEIEYFFETGFSKLEDPFLFMDMDKAVARIKSALASGEKIAIYGDFDADGVTACSLLVQYFRAVGADVIPRIPHRVDEGYGLNPSALKRLHEQGVKLVITVDCGISNVDEVKYASKLGLDVIVTDHHRPPEKLPASVATLNVRQPGCNYPYKGLAGVGVAFHLVRALAKSGVKSNGLKPNDLLDLVALGTVADIAPLTGENRILVASGLKALNKSTRPGIIALVEISGYKFGQLDTTSIGFGLAPRINAAGRIDDAILAYELLLTGSLEQARDMALQLNIKNRERQDRLSGVLEEARAQVFTSNKLDRYKILVLSGEGWSAGIVGLVAGKIAEEFCRPVLVLEKGGEFSKGSARSIASFNIIEALEECADLLVRYGGHRQAAGLTIESGKLPELEERLVQIADRNLAESDLQPRLEIDLTIESSQLEDVYQQSRVLAPFGNENPNPVFACYNLVVREAKPVGVNGAHLKLKLFDKNNSKIIDAIAFREGHRFFELKNGNRVDIVFNIEQKEFHGQKNLEIIVRNWRFSAN